MIQPALPCIVKLQLQPQLLQLRRQLLQLQGAYTVGTVDVQRLLRSVAACCKRPASAAQNDAEQLPALVSCVSTNMYC
jgi:hypothetical protein